MGTAAQHDRGGELQSQKLTHGKCHAEHLFAKHLYHGRQCSLSEIEILHFVQNDTAPSFWVAAQRRRITVNQTLRWPCPTLHWSVGGAPGGVTSALQSVRCLPVLSYCAHHLPS